MSKVLLINDSKFEGIIIKDILNSLGHDVKVTDEYNAINQVKAYCPDFLIANYIMKQIRGDQLIAIIKLSNPAIKCILSSSNDINEKEFEHKHIDAIIHTPIDRAGMERALTKVSTVEVSRSQLNTPAMSPVLEMASENSSEKYNIEGEMCEEEVLHEFDIVRFCPFCGHKLTEKDGETVRFCSYCGNRL